MNRTNTAASRGNQQSIVNASEPKERPILFSGPMVWAILGDRKTQTRRIVKSKDSDPSRCITLPVLMQNVSEWRLQNGRWFGIYGYDTLVFCDCPYGQPGDRLWVRESHALLTMMDGAEVCAYRASCDDNTFNYTNEFTGNVHCIEVERWRPSIHMTREASRITLEITGVRVERLKDISEGDSQAEGCNPAERICESCGWIGTWEELGDMQDGDDEDCHRCPKCSEDTDGWYLDELYRKGFKGLWESINGEGSWAENPWVWVVDFKRV